MLWASRSKTPPGLLVLGLLGSKIDQRGRLTDSCYSADKSIEQHDGPWWRHQMETISALLAICAGKSSVPGEFPAQRPVTRSFDVFFHLRLNERLTKQLWGWWFETPSCPSWCHCTSTGLTRRSCSLYWLAQILKYLHMHKIHLVHETGIP